MRCILHDAFWDKLFCIFHYSRVIFLLAERLCKVGSWFCELVRHGRLRALVRQTKRLRAGWGHRF